MRYCTRMRRRVGGLTAVYVILVHLATFATPHIPEIDDDIRIEPTPVLMLGPSSSHVVGYISFPLEGSSRQRRYDEETQEGVEGSGFGRTRRDYSLEDFLMWMTSGDGSADEWQHRPRDTSWMRRDVTTTTVYLTTTVYTTVIPIPFTPSTFTTSTFNPSVYIRPSAVTPNIAPPTKLPGDSNLEAVNSIHIPDKGGGKNLENSSGLTSTPNGAPTKGPSTGSADQDQPQSDYAPSPNSGNQIPGSPTTKDKTTKNQAKTNYITVTRTVTSPPTTTHAVKPSILTTTSTSEESQYDLTDLIHSSMEYPGPSATITASSITPTLVHVTNSIQPTVRPTLTQTLQPTSQTLVDYSTINTRPTTSGIFVPVTPTAVVSDTTNINYSEKRETPALIVPSSTSPSPDHENDDKFNSEIPTAETNSNLDGSIGDTTQASDEEAPVSIGVILTHGTTVESSYGIETTVNTVLDLPENGTTGPDSNSTVGKTLTRVTTEGMIPIPDHSNSHGSITHPPIHTTISADEDDDLATIENPVTEIVSVTESSLSGEEESHHNISNTDIISMNGTTSAPDVIITDTTNNRYPPLVDSTPVVLPESTTTDNTNVTLLSTLIPDQPTTSLVSNTFQPLFERNTTTVHEVELYDLTTPSTIYTGTDFGVTDMNVVNGNDNTPVDNDNGDTTADTGIYSSTYSPMYTILVPNSSTVNPKDGNETSDIPIFLTSTEDVDVVDPSPVDTVSEVKTDISLVGDVSTIVPGVVLENTTDFESDYSTVLFTDFTTPLESHVPEESTQPPFITDTTLPSTSDDSTLLPTTSDVSDSTIDSTFGINDTILENPPDSGYSDEENVNGTRIIGVESKDIDSENGDDHSKDIGNETDVLNSTVGSGIDTEEAFYNGSRINETLGGYPIDSYNWTIQITPSETSKTLFSSGIEASLSVVLLPGEPQNVTHPIETITPSASPSLPDSSVDSQNNTSDYDYGEYEPGSRNDTGIEESLQPTTVSPSTLITDMSSTDTPGRFSSYPTLQPSHESSEETDTSAVTFTTSLPTKEIAIFQSPESTLIATGESDTTDSSQYVTEMSTDLESTPILGYTTDQNTVSDFISIISEQFISSTPSSTSILSVVQTSQATTMLSTISIDAETDISLNVSVSQSSALPTSSENTTVSSTLESSVISTTQGSSLTPGIDSTVIPKMTTDLTTGAQPSPPSPSNNASVPLDQRYWVRTVLEGPPKEEDPVISWSNIQNKLTETYQLAYNRNSEALKYKNIQNQEDGLDSKNQITTTDSTTESTVTPTTVNPYENYTTIIGRRKREAPQHFLKSTPSWQDEHAGNAIVHRPLKFKMSPGLKRTKGLASLNSNEKEVKNIDHTIRPVSYVQELPNYPRIRRRRRKRSYLVESKVKSSDPARPGFIRNPFMSSRLLKTSPSYSLSIPITSVKYTSPSSVYATSHRRIKRTTAENINVRLHNVTYDNATDLTELVYTVFDGEWPILAKEAVTNMSAIDDMEMAVLLDQVVVVKAEEYLSSTPPPKEARQVYIIIGGVVGGVMLLVFVLWCAVFLFKRKARADETLQPDSQEASPRSQLSTNAYMGHINLAYSDARDEKVEATPMPSTSHPPADDLGRSSPSGSHDHLIRPKQGPSLGSRGKHFYQGGGKGDREGRSSGHTSHEGSSREEDEDYATTEEEEEDETTDLRRPKSSVPWKRGGRVIMDEPVYSSPKPISFQDQIIPSMNPRYETTHSEMSSSDPTQQLMANMLHGAQLFTNKDHGSLFLPPPLLPPPHGFGKSQDSSFIPGTSLPRFLPPPRPVKQINLGSSPDGTSRRIPSQIDAYSYDPEAPPIPPRNYTREEAGLPPIGDGSSPTRPPMRDAQVEARIESETAASTSSEDRMRRPSGSSSHLSDSGGSESSMPNVGRLRRRFHDLLDDAFSLLNGQRPGDKVTPLTTPTTARKFRSKSAAVKQRGRPSDVFEEESPGAAGRPWSAAAVHTTAGWKEAQVAVGVIPLDQSRSPRSAWGDTGRPGTSLGRPSSVPSGASRPSSVHAGIVRPSSGPSGTGRPSSSRSGRSITPVNMPPSSPDQTDGRRLSASITSVHSRGNEPLDPDTGLRANDPAVPLIRAIKDELKRFKTTVSTESSNA